MTQTKHPRTLAILGGTGNQGPGLALRWALAGHRIIIGSRKQEKAERVAAEINARLEDAEVAHPVAGMANPQAAEACDAAVLTVPYGAQNALLVSLADALEGKVLINVNVALKPPKVTRVFIPPEGSACEQAQTILGEATPVVGAFQNVSAHVLDALDQPVTCDVLVCGDDAEAKALAIALAEDMGTQGLDAGPLANAKAVEGLTAILIKLNIQHKVHGSGIRITGLPEEAEAGS
jgi:8-hydroxy-5-deazaflavin:NADPH oxidoreductase